MLSLNEVASILFDKFRRGSCKITLLGGSRELNIIYKLIDHFHKNTGFIFSDNSFNKVYVKKSSIDFY
ncbi:DUF3289 family protein [Taylorella equigenitalis]|uniref:DUF3289 family protein n=1 Tax=Taylorella equigenitalis TaxID=29575 RepID=UPI003BAD8C46|nr:DUF3289 family protein [Taylorella equigenitalis]